MKGKRMTALKLKNMALSLGEIIFGFVLTVVAAKLSLSILEFLWMGPLSQYTKNGLLSAILILLSFLFLCLGIIVSASEWMRIFKWHRENFFRADIYQGAFLGISTGMLLLLITEWSMNLIPTGGLLRLIRMILLPIATLVKLITLVIPPAIFILIFAPLGAFLGYRYSNKRFGKGI
jgi:hypothetical protein